MLYRIFLRNKCFCMNLNTFYKQDKCIVGYSYDIFHFKKTICQKSDGFSNNIYMVNNKFFSTTHYQLLCNDI